MATLLEDANEKLAELQNLLDKSHYQLEIENLQISNDLSQTNKIRLALVEQRKLLERERQTKETKALLEAIHAALVAITEAAPLNRLTEGGEMLCPITLQVFDPFRGVALTNGCIYLSSTISNYSADQRYFPRTLPGSTIEIDQEDVQSAQRGDKNRFIVNVGQIFGLFGTMAYGLALVTLKIFAGLNLLLLAESGLLALGVGAGVAAAGAAIAIVAPMAACFIIAAVLGAWYYSKHHPSQLAPAPDGPDASSTALSFDKMDVKPEEKKEFKQELAEAQRLGDLSAEEMLSVDEVMRLEPGDSSALAKSGEQASTAPKLV